MTDGYSQRARGMTPPPIAARRTADVDKPADLISIGTAKTLAMMRAATVRPRLAHHAQATATLSTERQQASNDT